MAPFAQVYIIYLNLVVHGLVPILLLVSLNLSIYTRLRYPPVLSGQVYIIYLTLWFKAWFLSFSLFH